MTAAVLSRGQTTNCTVDCVQVVVLESDFVNDDGSHNYTVVVNNVGDLAPYKLSHEINRTIVSSGDSATVASKLAQKLALDHDGNTIFVVTDTDY